MSLFSFFENRLNPYPDSPLPIPKNGNLFGFLWACTEGALGWILLLAILSILLGVFGSLLFAWVGDVVMDKGQIIEMGSHDELIAQGGVYANLWARQSGGFLGEMD